MFRVPYIMFMVVCLHYVSATTMDDVKTLMADLMANYSMEVRPVKNQIMPVYVDIGLAIVSINGFNEVTGVISIVAVFSLTWKDESLVWDPSNYDNTTSLTLSNTKIWVPKMYLINPADDFKPISNDNFKVTVSSTGFVQWFPGGLLKATCTPDVSNYPFDQQTCIIAVNAYGYFQHQISLTTEQPAVRFVHFSSNSAWDVISTKTFVTQEVSDIASFAITMKRRPLNFIASVVTPIIMLAIVNPFVFILPFNSGERISYSITVLLAFTVYMTVVSDRMPDSADPISQLSFYILSMLAISVFIVIINIFQIRTYEKDDGNESIPQWIRSLVLFLRKIHRPRQVKPNDQNKERNDFEKTEDLKKQTPLQLGPVGADEQMLEQSLERTKTASSQQEGITWNTVAKYTDKLYFTAFLVITVVSSMGYFMSVTT